jgi:hypothetical protein
MLSPLRGPTDYLRQVAMCLALSVAGGVAVFGLWLILSETLWLPYWRELRRLGFYTHDIDGAFMMMLGPPMVALLFLAGGLLEVLASARTGEHSSVRAFLLVVLAPRLSSSSPTF